MVSFVIFHADVYPATVLPYIASQRFVKLKDQFPYIIYYSDSVVQLR